MCRSPPPPVNNFFRPGAASQHLDSRPSLFTNPGSATVYVCATKNVFSCKMDHCLEFVWSLVQGKLSITRSLGPGNIVCYLVYQWSINNAKQSKIFHWDWRKYTFYYIRYFVIYQISLYRVSTVHSNTVTLMTKLVRYSKSIGPLHPLLVHIQGDP